MAEDYTYEPVTDVTALAARVQELEAQVQDLEASREFWRKTGVFYKEQFERSRSQREQELAAELTRAHETTNRFMSVGVRLERENAELRARLDAVPVAEIRAFVGAADIPMGYWSERHVIVTWLKPQPAQPAQPDDTDAPLTLATLDEDGDE